MNAIKAGDLVVIVRSHCAKTKDIVNWVSTVYEVTCLAGDSLECHSCGGEFAHGQTHARLDKGIGWMPAAWLRKIEPPSESNSIKHVEEVTA